MNQKLQVNDSSHFGFKVFRIVSAKSDEPDVNLDFTIGSDGFNIFLSGQIISY